MKKDAMNKTIDGDTNATNQVKGEEKSGMTELSHDQSL